METDIQRIGIGNRKFPKISEVVIVPPLVVFEFSTEEITFDSVDRTFDEV